MMLAIKGSDGFAAVTGQCLSDGGAGDRDLLPATSRTGMNGHHRGGHQADRMFGQGPDHFLTPLAVNQVGFALFVGHPGNPSKRA